MIPTTVSLCRNTEDTVIDEGYPRRADLDEFLYELYVLAIASDELGKLRNRPIRSIID